MKKQHVPTKFYNMEKMCPEISETIKKLKREKRIIAKKVLELSNTFKSTIARIEQKFDEKVTLFAIIEKKIVEDQTITNNKIPKTQ